MEAVATGHPPRRRLHFIYSSYYASGHDGASSKVCACEAAVPWVIHRR